MHAVDRKRMLWTGSHGCGHGCRKRRNYKAGLLFHIVARAREEPCKNGDCTMVDDHTAVLRRAGSDVRQRPSALELEFGVVVTLHNGGGV